MSFKGAATRPLHSVPQKTHLESEDTPSPQARCRGLPSTAQFLPPSSHRRAKAQLWAAPKSEQGLRAAPSTAAPQPRRHPGQRAAYAAGGSAPASPGGRSLRSSQACHRPATTSRASRQAGGRPLPHRPPALPPLPAPALPTPGFRRRRSSSPQHHLVPTPPTHSRERVRRLSREELGDQARAKVGGLLKNERGSRKKSSHVLWGG